MRFFTFIIAIIMALFSLPVDVIGQPKSLDKYVNRIVYEQVDFKKTPGVIIGIIEGDSTYIYAYGELEKEGGTITKNTIFEIGSVTKVFTASVLQGLVNDSLISYDDPVTKYIDLPNLNFEGKLITVRDLAIHFSGLPKLPHNFGTREKDPRNPYANYSNHDLLKFLTGFFPNITPGEDYHYSHLGYVLLAKVMEKAANKSIINLYDEYLLAPLDMTATKLMLEEGDESEMAAGYSLGGDKVGPWTYQSFEAALGMKSSMRDMLIFVKANLNEFHDLNKMFAPIHVEQGPTDKPKVFSGTGWHIVHPRKNSNSIIAHSGVTEGHRTFVAFVKETQTGIIVLSNSENSQNGIGGFILQHVNKGFKRKGDLE
ncbi:MAG: serine hydrolase domain-containing protein [Bacteroidota bacterium]